MNELVINWIIVALIFALSIILLVLFKKRVVFELFNDLIVIHDFAYPANIPNYAIKSITLIDKMPKVTIKSNGYGGIRTRKGIYRIIGGKRVILYVEDFSKSPFIKIETVRENVYINFKNKELTQQLYDEMTKTVKILPETDLADCKFVSTKRSWVIVGIFIAILIVLGAIPAVLI